MTRTRPPRSEAAPAPPAPARGRFIVVEGPDGGGKSTLVQALRERMQACGQTPVVVREPGGTPIAEALRAALLDPDRMFPPLMELLYYTAARADLVSQVIGPALEQGRTVLSDRYDLSTEAYQGAGRGIPPEQVALFNRAATSGLRPDLTLVVDVPGRTGPARRHASGKSADRLEREDDGFQARVVQHYLAASGPAVRHLDGTRPPDQVAEAAWREIAGTWPAVFGTGNRAGV
ncbi:MAG: dTMP kinase [Gemmatimonadales bacterium]